MAIKFCNSLDEQETVIVFNPKQISDKATVYTCISSVASKILKLKDEHPDSVNILTENKYGIEFEVPKDWIKIRPKKRMSDKQRQEISERFRRPKEDL